MSRLYSGSREISTFVGLQTRSALVRVNTFDAESFSVEAVIATESPVRVFDFRSFEDIDEVLLLDGVDLSRSMPLLSAHRRHDLDFVLGRIRELRVEGGQLLGRLFFVTGDEASERAANKVRQGAISDVSIGYEFGRGDFVMIGSGESAVVGGRTFEAGDVSLRVVTRWSAKEASLVPIGADELAQIRSEQACMNFGGGAVDGERVRSMNDMLLSFLRGRGLESGASEEDAFNFWRGLRGLERRMADRLGGEEGSGGEDGGASRGDGSGSDPEGSTRTTAESATSADSGGVNGVGSQSGAASVQSLTAVLEVGRSYDDGERAERERQTAIRALGEDPAGPVDATLVLRALSEGWDLPRSTTAFLEHLRASRAGAVEGEGVEYGELRAGTDNRSAFTRAATDGICLQYDVEPETPSAQRAAEEFRGVGLQTLARLCIEQDGHRAPVDVQAFFRSAVSTGSYADLLSASATKILSNAFRLQEGTFHLWTGVRDVPNFKTHNEIMISEFSNAPLLGDSGEFDLATIREAKEGYKTDTRGIRFVITRKTFIDDDLNAFTRVPEMFGRLFKRTIDDRGYEFLGQNSGVGPVMLEDGKNLFSKHADRVSKNLIDGAGSALSDAALTAGKLQLRQTKALSEDPKKPVRMNLQAKILLAPSELEDQVMRHIHSRHFIVGGGDTTVGLQPDKNIHFGTLEPVIEDRLSDTSTKAWYLFADPRVQANLVRVYLNGNRAPKIERDDPSAFLGIGHRMYFDYEVGIVNHRGAQRNKGE